MSVNLKPSWKLLELGIRSLERGMKTVPNSERRTRKREGW